MIEYNLMKGQVILPLTFLFIWSESNSQVHTLSSPSSQSQVELFNEKRADKSSWFSNYWQVAFLVAVTMFLRGGFVTAFVPVFK